MHPGPFKAQTDGDRRKAVVVCGLTIAGCVLPLTGCASSAGSPRVGASTGVASRRSTRELLARWGEGGTEVTRTLPPRPPHTPARLGQPEQSAAALPANLQRRSTWTQHGPNFSDMNRMGRVERITVHHDGMNVFSNTSRDASKRRLENIRSAHRNGNGWADIGYHFAVDPAGRVWEGRPIDWQGAHVKHHNERNLGILVMGNYESQRPTEIQLAAIKQLLQSQCTTYGVSPRRVYTHRELRPTACPGRYLQPRIAAIRGTLA